MWCCGRQKLCFLHVRVKMTSHWRSIGKLFLTCWQPSNTNRHVPRDRPFQTDEYFTTSCCDLFRSYQKADLKPFPNRRSFNEVIIIRYSVTPPCTCRFDEKNSSGILWIVRVPYFQILWEHYCCHLLFEYIYFREIHCRIYIRDAFGKKIQPNLWKKHVYTRWRSSVLYGRVTIPIYVSAVCWAYTINMC